MLKELPLACIQGEVWRHSFLKGIAKVLFRTIIHVHCQINGGVHWLLHSSAFFSNREDRRHSHTCVVHAHLLLGQYWTAGGTQQPGNSPNCDQNRCLQGASHRHWLRIWQFYNKRPGKRRCKWCYPCGTPEGDVDHRYRDYKNRTQLQKMMWIWVQLFLRQYLCLHVVHWCTMTQIWYKCCLVQRYRQINCFVSEAWPHGWG